MIVSELFTMNLQFPGVDQGHIYFETSSQEIKARIDNFLILSPDRGERIENLRKLIADIGPMSPDLSDLIVEAEKGELGYEQLDKLLHQFSNGVAALQNQLKNAYDLDWHEKEAPGFEWPFPEPVSGIRAKR